MAYVNRKVWAHRLENEVATISLAGVVRITDNSRSGSQEQTDELRRSRESIGGVSLSGKGRKKVGRKMRGTIDQFHNKNSPRAVTGS